MGDATASYHLEYSLLLVFFEAKGGCVQEGE
jgi:hypothetical protein